MDYEEIETMLADSGEDAAGEPAPEGAPTLKERFRRAMFFQEVEPLPNFEFGYWGTCLETWREQGLPADIDDEGAAYDYFGIENWGMVNVSSNPLAICEGETLEEDDDYITTRDSHGGISRINKKGDKSIPHFIEFPVKDRASWEPFKKAMDPDDPKRWESFDDSVKKQSGSTRPVGIYGGSLLGVARNLIGFERIATMPYEDPELITEIVNTFGEATVAVLEKALPRIQVDFCMGWEDICFNQGPILTPEFIAEVAGPWYRRIADVLTMHGCCVYTTDTDGNIMPIVDVFVSNGLNTMFPVEVHGGSDPVELRRRYGKRVRLWGGFCKMKLGESREAIDHEIERLRPLVEEGGFVPGVDHRVPASVPLDLYKYYLDRKREVFHVGGEPKY